MGAYYEFDEERDLNEYRPCCIIWSTFCIPTLQPLCLREALHPNCNERMPREAERLSCPIHMTSDSRTKKCAYM